MSVFKPRSENKEANSKRCVLSVEELTDMDDLDFESHTVTDAPGLSMPSHRHSLMALLTPLSDSVTAKPSLAGALNRGQLC